MDTGWIDDVIQQLVATGSVVDANGARRSIFPVALDPQQAAVLQEWVICEKPVHTIEIGLAYAFSTLHICRGLLLNGCSNARHVAMDPHQLTGYASAGLSVLSRAAVSDLVEFYPHESQLQLPRFNSEGRSFDLAYVDGNHRFDCVFVDLFYLGRLIRKNGVIILDDYDLPGIRRAVSFFVTNLNWTLEQVSGERLAVLRTASGADTRDFKFFVEF
jgi:predicted O-methyltransferase YrrM